MASGTPASGNPFDLAKKKTGGLPAKDYKAKTWTEAEVEQALEHYIEVSEDLWPFVRYGTHVRYVSKKEGFRPGGFVLRNPFDTEVKGGNDKKRFMKLQNNFNSKVQGYAEWIVAYEDIARLYVKPDASAISVQRMLETAVKSLNKNIKDLAMYAKKLEGRIAELEQR